MDKLPWLSDTNMAYLSYGVLTAFPALHGSLFCLHQSKQRLDQGLLETTGYRLFQLNAHRLALQSFYMRKHEYFVRIWRGLFI